MCEHFQTTKRRGRDCMACWLATRGQQPKPGPVPTPAIVAIRPLCRHCGNAKRSVNRPRGLCWNCYYTPGVRELYPSTSKYANRGVGNGGSNSPLPPAPTTAAPGTPEKLAVLEQRAILRQAICHPADARYEGDPRPLEFLKQKNAG